MYFLDFVNGLDANSETFKADVDILVKASELKQDDLFGDTIMYSGQKYEDRSAEFEEVDELIHDLKNRIKYGVTYKTEHISITYTMTPTEMLAEIKKVCAEYQAEWGGLKRYNIDECM